MEIVVGIVKWSTLKVHSTYVSIVHVISLVHSKITHKYAHIYFNCFLSRKQIEDFTVTICKLTSESKMYAQQVKITVRKLHEVYSWFICNLTV